MLLTGVEAGLLWVVDVSPTFNGEHRDRVVVACCEVAKAVAQIKIHVFSQQFISLEVCDLYAVMVDAARPGQPREKNTTGCHVIYTDTAVETICGWK